MTKRDFVEAYVLAHCGSTIMAHPSESEICAVLESAEKVWEMIERRDSGYGKDKG